MLAENKTEKNTQKKTWLVCIANVKRGNWPEFYTGNSLVFNYLINFGKMVINRIGLRKLINPLSASFLGFCESTGRVSNASHTA